jgi:hypothetical protein
MARPKKSELTPFQEKTISEQIGGELIKSIEGGNNNGAETKAETEAGVRVDTIFYHINYGQKQWREAVIKVEVGASPEFLARAAETVNALNEAFPMPSAGGINSWYNNAFCYAYMAVASYQRLVKMLTSMTEIMVANPGEVIVGWGKQFTNATIAEVADNPDGPSYMKWVQSQQGTDVIRIQAAYEAYQIARGAKATTQKENTNV